MKPGLYDEKDNLIFSWQELLDKGLAIEKNHDDRRAGTLYVLLKENNLSNTKVKLVVSDEITQIGDCAFIDCNWLIGVNLPNTIKAIGRYAFANNTFLEELTIPESVKEFGVFAFTGCCTLKEIEIPKSITMLSYGAFEFCEELEKITIPKNVRMMSMFAFTGCKGLKSIEILNPDIRIYKGGISGCKNLSKILIYKKACKNNPYIEDEYKDIIKYLEDLTLDDLLNKDYSLTEANKMLNEIQTEAR